MKTLPLLWAITLGQVVLALFLVFFGFHLKERSDKLAADQTSMRSEELNFKNRIESETDMERLRVMALKAHQMEVTQWNAMVMTLKRMSETVFLLGSVHLALSIFPATVIYLLRRENRFAS